MSLVLHPRVAAGDRVQVWTGAFDRSAPPVLDWWLDGQVHTPFALDPIQSARSNQMVQAGELRAFTGVYEFRGSRVKPGTTHRVEVQSRNPGGSVERAQVSVRTLPSQVPSDLSKWFNVLMVSCFHRATDRAGLAGHVVAQLAKSELYRPDMTLLLGDQVYLDLPTFGVSGGLRKLARKFENDYRLNWADPKGYSQILRVAPSVSIPDDHEYWNNFPHPASLIPQTWNQTGRKSWKRAANRMYEAFQLPRPGLLGDPVELDVPPISFFLMDTRSLRDVHKSSVMSGTALRRLRDWVTRLINSDPAIFGVIASGQPLLDRAAGRLQGRFVDYTLPNYGDFPMIAKELSRLADSGRQFLLLSGDVHWGRVSEGTNRTLGRPSTAFYEVISSPTSLVAMIGKDQALTIFDGMKGILGNSDRFPRHPEPEQPPDFFAQKALAKRLQCKGLHCQKGNQVVLLSFRRAGFGLELLVRFWPIHRRFRIEEPERIGPLKLLTA